MNFLNGMKKLKNPFFTKNLNFIIKKSFAKPNRDLSYQNTSTPTERLNNKAKNYGASTEQTQNYEKNIYAKKKMDDMEDISKDLEGLLDNIESTNSQYLKSKESFSSTPQVNEMSYDDYLRQSNYIFQIMINAFKELLQQDKNLSMDVDRNNLFIRINVNKLGTYIIAKELETRVIAVTSPMTGLFKYKYDPLSRYWISTKDKHIMDELLMREFCHHSKGLLIFNY
jgi:frataxin-like iron-binding protein CyaY